MAKLTNVESKLLTDTSINMLAQGDDPTKVFESINKLERSILESDSVIINKSHVKQDNKGTYIEDKNLIKRVLKNIDISIEGWQLPKRVYVNVADLQ